MATITGINLLNSIILSTGNEINALVRATLSAKLQQMIDNGTYSKLAASIAISGFSTTINDTTTIKDLSDGVEKNAALISAEEDGAVDDIVFPPIGETPTFTLISTDQGTLENPVALDASLDGFQFNDNASIFGNVEINDFTNDDVIKVSNATDGDYSFSNDGQDVYIIYNNVDAVDADVINQIKLVGVATVNDLIYDETSFETVMGFNAFELV